MLDDARRWLIGPDALKRPTMTQHHRSTSDPTPPGQLTQQNNIHGCHGGWSIVNDPQGAYLGIYKSSVSESMTKGQVTFTQVSHGNKTQGGGHKHILILNPPSPPRSGSGIRGLITTTTNTHTQYTIVGPQQGLPGSLGRWLAVIRQGTARTCSDVIKPREYIPR